MRALAVYPRVLVTRIHRSRRRLGICAVSIVAFVAFAPVPEGIAAEGTLGRISLAIVLLTALIPVGAAIVAFLPGFRRFLEGFALTFPLWMVLDSLDPRFHKHWNFLGMWLILMLFNALLYGKLGTHFGRLKQARFETMRFIRLPREMVIALDAIDPDLPPALAPPNLISRRQVDEKTVEFEFRNNGARHLWQVTVHARDRDQLHQSNHFPDAPENDQELLASYGTETEWTRRTCLRTRRNIPVSTALGLWLDDLYGLLDDEEAREFESRVAAGSQDGPVEAALA